MPLSYDRRYSFLGYPDILYSLATVCLLFSLDWRQQVGEPPQWSREVSVQLEPLGFHDIERKF